MPHHSYRWHVAQELYAQTEQLHELFDNKGIYMETELNRYRSIVRNKKNLEEAFEHDEDCTGIYEELYRYCREYVEFLWDRMSDTRRLGEYMQSMIWLATYIMNGTD